MFRALLTLLALAGVLAIAGDVEARGCRGGRGKLLHRHGGGHGGHAGGSCAGGGCR